MKEFIASPSANKQRPIRPSRLLRVAAAAITVLGGASADASPSTAPAGTRLVQDVVWDCPPGSAPTLFRWPPDTSGKVGAWLVCEHTDGESEFVARFSIGTAKEALEPNSRHIQVSAEPVDGGPTPKLGFQYSANPEGLISYIPLTVSGARDGSVDFGPMLPQDDPAHSAGTSSATPSG